MCEELCNADLTSPLPTQADYQDFELPLSDETDLVISILKYAGLSIREADIYNAADSQQKTEIIQENS